MTTETLQDDLNVINDPRMYVLTWLSLNAITVNERGELEDSLRRDNSSIFTTMWLDYKADVRRHNKQESHKSPSIRNTISQSTTRELQMALDELIDKEKATHRIKSAKDIQCHGSDLSEVEKFVEALTGDKNPIEVNVMAHWLWMVKRKMLKQSVTNHIMPILYGPQGSGKTIALNKLISPLEVYRLNIKMNQMTDDRYFQSMSENYVIVFDEMQGAAKTDIDALKNQITTDWNDSRKLSTHNVVKLRQSCSFIGASNKHVSELIIDSTGMRRFYQIDTLPVIQWNKINEIDYPKLWTGIDEKLVDGYITPFLYEISKAQQNMTHKDEVTCFIEEFNIAADDSTGTTICSADIYKAYKNWATNSGYNPVNIYSFGKLLSNKGLKSRPISMSGRTQNAYKINSNSKLFDT